MSDGQVDRIVINPMESQLYGMQFFEENVAGVYLANINGDMIICNEAFAEIFGFANASETLGINLESFYPDRQAMDAFIQLVLKEKKVIRHESTMCGRDGAEKIIVQNTTGVFDELGNMTGFRGFLVDITKQKNLEKQVIEAQKMEAIGSLAGGIAHDFNNLLMAIQGNVSLMLMDADEAHPFYKQLTAIEKKIFEGARLTSHVLGYARKGKNEVNLLDLNRLIQETSEAFGRMRKEIKINTDLTQNLSRIKADRSQMEQVLLNLCIISADTMPSGGEMKIETEMVSHTCRPGDQHRPKMGNYVKLRIAGKGNGMNLKTKNRTLGLSLSTEDKNRRGESPGLSAAYGIISGYNGYIEIESEISRSPVFCIYLPILNNEERFMNKTEVVTRSKNEAEKVLLVDDDKMVLDVGRKVLEKLNYEVFNALGGMEAIEILKQQNGGIDIVILDMIMPEMNCEDTYDQLKQIDPEVRVLLSSGYDMNGQAKKMMDRGCDSFIQKPFRFEEISAKIMEIMSKN